MLKKRLQSNEIVTVTILKGADVLIKQIIYKVKIKKWCKALNEFDLTELADKGNYILSLCVDKETGNTFEPIEHHLPLIDVARSEQDINNWDLSENVKSTVKSYLKDLMSYADIIIKAYSKPCSDMVDILPLWIVFPTYSATTIGWRMGLGEQYEVIYLRMLDNMSSNKRIVYKSRYPAPKYMVLRSRYDNYREVQ